MDEAALPPGVETERHPALDEACARLRGSGLRLTQPRVAMLNALLRRPAPQSLESLHQQIGGACDLVTVYRSIASLHAKGLVRRLFSHGGVALYQLAFGPEQVYVMARADGEPIAGLLSPEILLAITKVEDALRALGYREVEHVVQLFVEGPVPTSS